MRIYGARRLCIGLLAAAAALGGTGCACPPTGATADPAAVAAYERFARLGEDAAAIALRLNAQARRADGRSIFVELSANPGGPPENWPDDYAPREEFLKLAEHALATAVEQGIPQRLAEVSRSPAIAFPAEHPAHPARLRPTSVRFLLDIQERLILRSAAAGDDLAAADGLLVYLRISRLAVDAEGLLSVVASGEIRRGVEIGMSLVANGKLGPAARRRLAEGLPPPPGAPADELAARHARLERDVRAVWKTLPPELFRDYGEDDEAADKAWESVDGDTRVFLGVLGAGSVEGSELPLPTAEMVLDEARQARGVLRGWSDLPPALVQANAREMEAAAHTRPERHTASLVGMWAMCLRESAEAGLALDALRVVLALEAFKDDSGAYPGALGAMVPKYLAAVPADPSLPGAPLCYRPGPCTYAGRTYPLALYSRGADGADDGGRLADWTSFSLGSNVRSGEDVILNAFHAE